MNRFVFFILFTLFVHQINAAPNSNIIRKKKECYFQMPTTLSTVRPETQPKTNTSTSASITTVTSTKPAQTSRTQPESVTQTPQKSPSGNFSSLAINAMTQFAAKKLNQDELETFISSLESLRSLHVHQHPHAAAALPSSNTTLISQSNMMQNFAARNLSQAQLGQLKSLLAGTCWRDSFGRGGGESVSTCASNEEKDGALCYPKCNDGYSGNGPVCWEICKQGFRDSGVFCIMDLDIYSKGCCCLADGKCCRNCRANYTDDGCTCRRAPVSYTKKSYGRGTGTGLKCKDNWELNGALCYPICQDGYSGSGPVCWSKCIEPLVNDCGGMCTLSESACAFKSFNLVWTVGIPFKTMAAWIAGPAALTGLTSVYDIPVEYSVPKCLVSNPKVNK